MQFATNIYAKQCKLFLQKLKLSKKKVSRFVILEKYFILFHFIEKSVLRIDKWIKYSRAALERCCPTHLVFAFQVSSIRQSIRLLLPQFLNSLQALLK